MVQPHNSISVIVSAYERPRHLLFMLLALGRQSVGFDELIIADDGSGREVQSVIEAFASRAPTRVVHVSQEHKGYRLARSRNNAIRVASGEYLVFLDEETTADLREEDIASGRFERLLDKAEMKKLRKLQRKDNFYAFFRKHLWPIKCKPKLRGGNFSIYRADLLKVNGFDENYVGWGQEDDDLGRRLYLAGMTSHSVVASAITFHLHHPLPADATARWKDGRNVAYYLRKRVSAYAENGLQKKDGYPPDDVKVRVYRGA